MADCEPRGLTSDPPGCLATSVIIIDHVAGPRDVPGALFLVSFSGPSCFPGEEPAA